MSQNVQILRLLVEERLTAAVEEIFGLFERTISEYEEELCRAKEENQRQREILEEVWNKKGLLNETDVHQLSDLKEEFPLEQQELGLDQENPHPVFQETPEPRHVFHQQEELLNSREADVTAFPSISVLVKSEEDELEVQSSQLHHRKMNQEEMDVVDYKGSKAPDCFHGDLNAQTVHAQTEHTDNSNCDWKEAAESDSNVNVYNKAIDAKCNGKKCFFCSLCGKKFANKSNITRHVFRYHATRQILSCPFCGKTFGEKENLKKHIAVHTGEKRSRSSVWDKSWRLLIKSRRGIAESTEKKGLLNDLPEGSRGNTDRVQMEDMEYRAAPHSFWKNRRYDRRSFYDPHKEDRPFVCQFCGMKYKRYSSLSCHLNIHRGETEFHCRLCGQRFTRWSKWRTHKCFLCTLCNKRFTCMSLYKRHKCGHGSGSEKTGHTNADSVGGRAEPTRSSDSSQYQPPEGETEGPSKAGFGVQQSGLKSQMKSKGSDARPTTNEKSHACSECGKRFWTRALLEIHIRVHTGEKPFSCPQCGRRFSQKANLLRHMVSHTGVKPFSCSVCLERFTQKNSLKKHMNIHKREKQLITVGHGHESGFQRILPRSTS